MALDIPRPNDLQACWMPFTANRQFKKAPRLIRSAEGMHYTTVDGRKILDSSAGLWCCNAGHRSPRIVKAVQTMVHELDFAPSFQFGHPSMFELANRMLDILPDHMAHVMFTNSGSEAVETALKIAIAYHHARGEGQRFRLVGRERGYHGVNFGGTSVGGIVNNRKVYGALLAGVDHMRHTHQLERNAFSRSQPENGAELADDLERIAMLHGPETIAAVIVEPVAGSTGVLIPPKGYLERLRGLCDKYGILLIFDEVITGFGRLGSPFAATHYNVMPDIITCAKGLTNGIIPMGAAICTAEIHDAFMHGPEHLIELFHGYTYSGNPVASAAGLAALETYREDGIFDNARKMAPALEEGVHALADHPHVIDIRNEGMVAAVELEPYPDAPTKRANEIMLKAFERGLMIRATGDIIALSPPLIAEQKHLDELFGILGRILQEAA